MKLKKNGYKTNILHKRLKKAIKYLKNVKKRGIIYSVWVGNFINSAKKI